VVIWSCKRSIKGSKVYEVPIMTKRVAEDKKTLETKHFKGFLIVDYRSGKMRVRKMDPKKLHNNYRKLNPFEIPITIELKINVPRGPEIVAKGEVTIPPTQVREMFLESL